MRKIVLLCAAGLSSKIVESELQKRADEIGYDAKITAYPSSDLGHIVDDIDLILLSPQALYEKEDIQRKFPTKKVDVIDARLYGAIDAVEILNFVKEILED